MELKVFWQTQTSLFCGARDHSGLFLSAVSFFTVLPCGMAIKQHCTGLSLHTELQLKHAYKSSECMLRLYSYFCTELTKKSNLSSIVLNISASFLFQGFHVLFKTEGLKLSAPKLRNKKEKHYYQGANMNIYRLTINLLIWSSASGETN